MMDHNCAQKNPCRGKGGGGSLLPGSTRLRQKGGNQTLCTSGFLYEGRRSTAHSNTDGYAQETVPHQQIILY